MKPIVIAMTGASGAAYGVRLLQLLTSAGVNVHLTLSPAAAEVIETELGKKIDLKQFDPDQLLSREIDEDSSDVLSQNALSSIVGERSHNDLTYHHYQDYHAGIASGSFLTGGMVVCPCSMGTLAALANGLSANLIHRAAHVHLKERRKLIVVPRETPLSGIHLDNMKRLSDAGAVILPAMPGFYHRPTSVEQLVDFIAHRILDQLGIPTLDAERWGGDESALDA
ncbi:MAG TPA: flavin prenyltransferase UbiX [Planctomycetaceae bacterium]|nr:flavin prenyltransferase UbiX [Planctomycetaceae bacterium]